MFSIIYHMTSNFWYYYGFLEVIQEIHTVKEIYMKKKLLQCQTVFALAFFAALGLVYVPTAYSQSSNVSFPSGFVGTWKRDNFNNTLAFTARTVKASSSSNTWNLVAINGNAYKMNNGKTDMTLTMRLDGGNLVISGDSGQGENNWNGIWKKQTQAASSAPAQPSAQAQREARSKYNDGMGYYNGSDINWAFDYNRAIDRFTEALRLDPANGQYPYMRGRAYYVIGDYDQAIADFTAALRIEPNNADFLLQRGLGYAGKGDLDRAIADYTAVIRIKPDTVVAFNNRGLAYTKKGDTDKAGADFTAAFRIDPNNTEARSNLIPYRQSTPVQGANLIAKLVWVLRNAQSGGDYTIELTRDETLEPQTLTFEGKTNVTLRFSGGEGEKNITLVNNGSLFTVASGVNLVLGKGVTLRGHKENNAPLVLVNKNGVLIMNEGSKIISNTTSKNGGGVSVNGIFIMNGGEISGNTSSSTDGGGVYIYGGTFTMNGGKISGNTASYYSSGFYSSNYGYGGGVYVDQEATFIMSGGLISGNTTGNPTRYDGRGGGVYVVGSKFISSEYGRRSTLANGTFRMSGGEISGNNSATGSGVYVSNSNSLGVGGIFAMNGGKITDNNSGGGVVVYDGAIFTMSGGKISNNTASNGGGVYVSAGKEHVGIFRMSGGEISGNTASDSGGGVYLKNRDKYIGGTFTMSGGEISGNTANGGGGNGGGGVYVGGSFSMRDKASVSGNTASGGNGGGILISGGGFSMDDNTTVSGNKANDLGGGVCIYSGYFSMRNGIISGNTAWNYGGGVYVKEGNFAKKGGTIYGYENGDNNSNAVKEGVGIVQNNKGHAVFVVNGELRRESTTGPDDNPDTSKTGLAGGWGY